MVIGVVCSERCHVVDQLSARDLPNVHGSHCIIKPIDMQFPALSPRHCMLTYGDGVIEHVNFYGIVHAHCVDLCLHWRRHASAAVIGVSLVVSSLGITNDSGSG